MRSVVSFGPGRTSIKGADIGRLYVVTIHPSQIEAPTSSALEATPSSIGVYRHFFKRVIDVVAILITLPFILPFLLIIAALISMDGHSPIFRQERVGIDGKRFRIWKFRTMVPDAEAMLTEYLASNPEAKAEWETKQKLNDDPRCTRIGRILRRTSMDELLQLVNVLTGDMTLVGPRPMMPSQQALYPGHAYYRLRPGMTGSWQISARNEATFAERAVFDDRYEQELSLGNDLSIIAKTVGVVLRGTGV